LSVGLSPIFRLPVQVYILGCSHWSDPFHMRRRRFLDYVC
jgi:hypothetical protein